MANASERRGTTTFWPSLAAVVSVGAYMSLLQDVLPSPQTDEARYVAPISPAVNELDQGQLRVMQELTQAMQRHQLLLEAETSFGEVEVDYSDMNRAAAAAVRAPAALFTGLDPQAFAHLSEFTYTLDGDEG